MPILPVPSIRPLVQHIRQMLRATQTHRANLASLTAQQTQTLLALPQRYRQHSLHYTLKALGSLPDSVLQQMTVRLQTKTQAKAQTYTRYQPFNLADSHADAHMQLLLAISAYNKTDIASDTILLARQQYRQACLAMQAPVDTDTLPMSIVEQHIYNADGDPIRLRCYQHLQGNPDQVVVLFMHGGGFSLGDLDTHDEFCRLLCQRTHWSVVSVDYRLAPESCAPTALYDCLHAYEWLAQHASKLHASPARIVLAGDSAGGCLAILVAQQLAAQLSRKCTQQHTRLIQPLALLAIYPATDMENDYPSRQRYGQGLPLSKADIKAFNEVYVRCSEVDEDNPLVTPMQGNIDGHCPSYVMVAELDMLHDEGLAYAQLLQDAGIPVHTQTVLGAPHGFLHILSVHQGVKTALHDGIDDFVQLLKKHWQLIN